MNIQAPAIRTADDFLRWNEGREGKREFVRGRIVEMMTGVSRAHWLLANRFHRAVGAGLDDLEYSFGTADFGVRTANGIRYPDLLVMAAESGTMRDLATDAPLLVAEILSPSSMALDSGDKAQEYKAIETLRHYLVLSQDEPRAWLWSRDLEGRFGEPEMLVGYEENLVFSGLSLSIPLAELYRGIA